MVCSWKAHSYHSQLIGNRSSSDPAMKQFLLHLDDTVALGRKFIIQDLVRLAIVRFDI